MDTESEHVVQVNRLRPLGVPRHKLMAAIFCLITSSADRGPVMRSSPVHRVLSDMLGVGEGSGAQLVETEQQEAQKNKQPTRRRQTYFLKFCPLRYTIVFVLFLC